MRVNKNIKHLLNSESFLPASSAGVQPFVRQPQQCPPGSLIKTMCNDCINGRQVASRQYEKENRLDEDRKYIGEVVLREQQQKQQQLERKRAVKNQLSMDISQFLQSQHESRQRQKQNKLAENARERQRYTAQQLKLKQEEQQMKQQSWQRKDDFRAGLKKQLKEKSLQISRNRSDTQLSLHSSNVSQSIAEAKENKRVSQLKYHLELDLQVQERQQSRTKEHSKELEFERKRLSQQMSKELAAEKKDQQESKQKALRERSFMQENNRALQMKKVLCRLRQEQLKKEREENRETLKQYPCTPTHQPLRKVCIQLRDAMLQASRQSRSRGRKSAYEASFDQLQLSQTMPMARQPPAPKACCEGCHQKKNSTAFGNFMI